MAARIRLKRIGKPHRPFYRIVVIEKSDTKDGRVIEVLGDYNPLPNPSVFNIDKEKTLAWIKKGATPSKTVERLLKKSQALNS